MDFRVFSLGLSPCNTLGCLRYKKARWRKRFARATPPRPTNTTSPSMPYCDICEERCHCCCPAGPHCSVPQREYVAARGARPEEFKAMEIIFRKNGICGIPVQDGVSKKFRDLQNRDSRPFENATDVSDQVTLRLEWPGYASWTATFRTRDSTPQNIPLPLSQVAADVCKKLQKFLNDMEGKSCGQAEWRIGRNTHLNVNTLALVSLQRKSLGTFVAEIRLPEEGDPCWAQ